MNDQPSHDVQFRFADGTEHSIAVPHGSSVLDAALAQDVPLLFQCRSGTCSSCIARLVEGEADMRAGQASVLLASEAASGMRLLCCTEARSMCSFRLDYDSKASGGGPRKASAFVDRVERIASDAVRLVLELAEGDWIDFRPGQFVQVKIPAFARRTNVWLADRDRAARCRARTGRSVRRVLPV
jgi:benzoate/toluate 1,2-dioxygenase reductase component